MSLTTDQVNRFVEDGFVALRGAFPTDVGEQCRRELWEASGYDPDDSSTWREPLVRLGGLATPAFRAAANTDALHAAFDQLVGVDAWEPRTGLGSFPLRFPGTDDAPEGGWHLEASFHGSAGEPRVNLSSRGRALLMLFLFSEVGPDDAPTRVRVGSHLDVPRLLEPAGEQGMEWMALCEQAVPASAHRPVELVTGGLGDVYLCHPFLIHAASAHRGRTPRFMAQPELAAKGPLDLDAAVLTPVAQAIVNGLSG